MNINLLPWRDAHQKRKKIEALCILGAACLFSICLVMYVSMSFSSKLADEKTVVKYLDSKISALDKSLLEINNLEEKKSKLLAQVNILQKLQVQRTETAQIFDELVYSIPDELTFSDVERVGDKLIISGIASSNSDVSRLMKNIEDSVLLRDPRLLEIEKQTLNEILSYKFYIDVRVESFAGTTH
jgi:type IV pilus assembly protein PilN|tara:strand:- start:3676 stop:4230 length:555 start_codon:yes stop_codon:yes gene_type:complete